MGLGADGAMVTVGNRTATFVLGDVEGSTRRWAERPEVMAEAMESLDVLLDGAVQAHAGNRPLEQGEGDSFVLVFAGAADALACALDVQRGLVGGELAVRMAIHTGDAEERPDGRWMGSALNRCARIRSVAHGGQVLVSEATAAVIADLPDRVTLRDLGRHRLKDLAHPEKIRQLCHPDLADEFPPLASGDRSPHNLPVELSSFVGRQNELDELGALLDRSRLVTLTGAGGSGKTRLAVHVASCRVHETPAGVWFADLSAIADPTVVASVVAAAMRVPEQPSQPVLDTVIAHVAEAEALLLLDNCEHLLDSCAAASERLLRGCPGLKVVATSREPLGIDGEVVYRVPSLASAEAIQLFVERARAVRPTFVLDDDTASAVRELCRGLDGLPLGIELAAARVRLLSPAQLVARLEDRFRLLSGGRRSALPRHQTLAASVAWSHDLLDPAAQVLLRRLAVFPAGWTLELAEQVCATDPLDPWRVFDLLAALVDASMVQVEDVDGTARYRMLETIRQFALDRLLQADEATAVADRLLGAMVELAERAEPELTGINLRGWADMLAREYANIETALLHGVTIEPPDLARRLAAALAQYWDGQAHMQEGTRWLVRLWEGATDLDPQLEVRLAGGVARLSFGAGDHVRAAAAGGRTLEIATALDDPFHIGRAHNVLGFLWLFPRVAEALTHFGPSVVAARRAGDRWTETDSLIGLGFCHGFQGRLEEARAAFDEAARLAGDRDTHLAAVLSAQGQLSLLATDSDPEPLLLRARRLGEQAGDVAWTQLSAILAGEVARRKGRTAEAIARLEASLDAAHASESPFTLLGGRLYLALAKADAGDNTDAIAELERLVADAEASLMTPYVEGGLIGLSWLLSDSGSGAAAVERAEEALRVARAHGYAIYEADALSALAAGWLAEGDTEQTEELAHDALRRHTGFRSAAAAADDLDLLATVAAGQESDAEALRLAAAAQSVRAAVGLRSWSSRPPALDTETLQASAARVGEEAAARVIAEGEAMALAAAATYAARGRGERRRPPSGWSSLTPTELEVVKLVARGLTNPQVAAQLFIGPATVKSHLKSVFAKLGVTTRAQLAALATRRGI